MDAIITRGVGIPRLGLARFGCRAAAASLSPNARSRSAIAQVAIAWLLDQDGVIAIPKAQREPAVESRRAEHPSR
jgi:diketogulonate reductase-like aldo/keto reductase